MGIGQELQDAKEQTEVVHKKSDKDWNQYVLDQLDPSELQEGNPTTDGLRRVAELLLGEIFSQISQVRQSPDPDNNYTAVVEHHITFSDGKSFMGCADAHSKNTDKPYDKYTTAVAETRAEGRALRRALGLKKPVADELSNVANEEDDDGTLITDFQAKTIKQICKRNDINIESFINSGKETYEKISDVSHSKAQLMIQQLNKYQQKPDKIPDNFKLYKE